ncbi:MAG: hypothetical protein FJ350_03725 [Sphingomonadales bacterium]|nr:hypothetical protein [Sphingomonadales bacterium]
MPSLDFEKEPLPDAWGIAPGAPSQIQPPKVQWNPRYNPFEADSDRPRASVDPATYWNAQTVWRASADPDAWQASDKFLTEDQTWEDDGRILGGQWAVFMSDRDLYIVNVPALHGVLKTERLLKELDGIFKPTSSDLKLQTQGWTIPQDTDLQELRSCALPLGVELEAMLPQGEAQVTGIPAGSSWAEVSDLLDYLSSCISQGHVPDRSETLGHLARRRGTASVPALLDEGIPKQISLVLRQRIREGLPLHGPDGRSVWKVVHPQSFFGPNFEPLTPMNPHEQSN